MRRLICVALVGALAATAALAQNEAVIARASGRVEVMPPGGSWTPAAAGARLAMGATISTGFQSEATLEIGQSVVQVKPLTRMRIDELVRTADTQSTTLALRVGRVRAEVKTVEGLKQDFKVKSPVSTAAVRGTAFEYDGVNLQVLEGMVTLANQWNQSKSLGAGEQGEASGDEPPKGGEDKLEEQSTTDPSAGMSALPSSPPPAGTGSIRVDWQVAGGW